MKRFFQFLLMSILVVGIATASVDAKPRKSFVLPEKVIARTESKVEELTKKIQKEIGLTEKQLQKVYAIKLQEAQAIESQRLDTKKTQHEIKNEIILITADANKKVSKVLKKDQRVIWEVKKDNFAYNPGILENLKDIFKNTKENIQEKLK